MLNIGKYVDLNSDVGESYGCYKLGLDELVMKHISSVNIACGWHAGDPLVMEDTVNLARQHGLGIGAHPGYPDLIAFGRRNIDISPKEARTYLIYQLGSLTAFAAAVECSVDHVKLHGAFYNMVSVNSTLAKEIAKAVYEVDKNLIVLALAGSELVNACRQIGLKVAEEVFADRAYNSDGTLVSRKLPGSMIHNKEEAAERAVKMALEGKVKAIDGKEIKLNANSICVHGDNPEAVAFVELISRKLKESGVEISSLKNFI